MIAALQAIKTRHGELWAVFRGKYPTLPEKPPKLAFDKRIRKAWAYAYGTECIRLSFEACLARPELYLSDIVGHELAHVVQAHIDDSETEDHGKTWARLMREIGLEPKEFYE